MAWGTFVLILVALSGAYGASLDLEAEIQRLADRTTNCPNSGQLCVCAFNIQTFGKAKMDKPHVVEVLIEVQTKGFYFGHSLLNLLQSTDDSQSG